ncbi:MAG: polysaccharide deacetylase family protein [Akkermansiaceae bacterium]
MITHRSFVFIALSAATMFVSCSAKDKKEDLPLVKTVANKTTTSSSIKKPSLKNPNVTLPSAGKFSSSKVSYSRVSTSSPYIAMTFDDGPHPQNTPRLLDMLRERNIKATFYVVGNNVKMYPHIIRRIVAEGHEIGNHTVKHPNLSKMSNAAVRQELNGCRDAIVSACGVKPRTMRPPYGALNSSQRSWIFSEYGYPTILWDVDPQDWKKPGASVVSSRIINGTRNGSIVLAHDLHKSTIDAMPRALDGLLQKGFKFVTVSQLLNLNGTAAAQ